MELGTLLLLLLVLACPLSMLLMHRRGHAHGPAGAAADEKQAGHGCCHDGHDGHAGHEHGEHDDSIDELRRRRDELDAEIEERERAAEPLPR